MQCLILAGGPGTRMRPLTERLPKPLLPVNGVPFVHYQLDRLASQGVKSIVFSVGYLGGMIRGFVGDGGRWRLKVVWVDEGGHLRGTAGAIRLAIDEGVMDEEFMVIYGDSYPLIDLPPLWKAAWGKPDPTMAVFRNDGRWDKSNVIFKDGRVILYEKGRNDEVAIGMRHIDYGLSVLSRKVMIGQTASGEWADLADVFHRLSIEGRLSGYEVADRFYEIGSPEGFREFEAYVGREKISRQGAAYHETSSA